MKIYRSSRSWLVLALAAIAAVVPTASAQATTTQAVASSRGVVAATGSGLASSSSLLMPKGFAARSLRPAAVARAGANANPASYTVTDPSDDSSGPAADITGVVVSSDANKQITFRINVAKLVVPSDGHVVIAIDSDQSAATGYQGIDYMFLGDLSTNSFVVGRWNGSDFLTMQEATATASTDNSGLTFSINSGELGNTTGFNFFVRTVQGTEVSAGHYDDAPDQGTWNYQLGPTAPLTLTVGLTTVSKARAGKPFVALIEVVRSDGADTNLTASDVSCTATVGTTTLKARTTVGEGPAAGCGWRLPKKSRGKTLRASVTATLDGATVTKTLSARIR